MVTRDVVSGGGRVYKFWGYAKTRMVDDPVGQVTITQEQGLWYRLWEYFTGQAMERVQLNNPNVNRAYIEGRRITPWFRLSINRVKGYRPEREEAKDVTAKLDDIWRSETYYNYLEHNEAKNMARRILNAY